VENRWFGAVGAVTVLALLSTWMLAGPAHAIWVDLTPEQKDRAQKIGGFNASMGSVEKLVQPWMVQAEGEHKGAAILMTEFLSLAFAAMDAARNFAALQPWEAEDAIGRARGKLVFSVTTIGPTDGYADGLRGWVEVGGKRIQNTHWQNGKPEAQDGGFIADSTFWFPIQGIDPNAQITLHVVHDNGKLEWRFPVDLSKMR